MTQPLSWDDRQNQIQFQNKSGEQVPPFGAMQLDLNGGTTDATFDRDGEICFRIKKPDADGEANPALIIFNGPYPVPDDGFGSAMVSSTRLALCDFTDGEPQAGEQVGPQDDSWYLSVSGSGFKCKSQDALPAFEQSESEPIKTIWIEPQTSDGVGLKSFNTNTGIAARPAGAESAMNFESCQMYNLTNGTRSIATGETRDVYNPYHAAIPGDVFILAAIIDGVWTVVTEDCDYDDGLGGAAPAPLILEHSITSGPYTAGTNLEEFLFVDCTSGNITVVLDKDVSVDIYIVLRVAGGNTLTLDPDGTENIDGATTKALSTTGDSVHVVRSNVNSEWWTVGK